MSAIQVIMGGLPHLLLSPSQDVKKRRGEKMGGEVNPAKELFSVITSDWKIVCFKEQKPEALLVRGDLKFLINRKQKYHAFHIICSCHTAPVLKRFSKGLICP